MKINSLKEKGFHLFNTTTVYGIRNLVNSKSIISITFWLLFLCASVILASWNVYDTVISYLKFEITTKVESIYEQPLQFPVVSFCSYSNGDRFKNPLKNLLNDCWFNLDRDCKENPDNYFQSFINEVNGQCFRFNAGKNLSNNLIPFLNSNIGGRDDSLRIKLYDQNGLWVWIHDSLSPPKTGDFNNHNGNGILVSPSAETQLIVHKVVEKSLGKPYNQCYKNVSDFEFNKTIIDYIQMKGETYIQANCFELCFDLDYIENNPCNCTNSSIGTVWPECFIKFENKKQDGCTYEYKIKFFKNSLIQKCTHYCPLECDLISYSVSINSFTAEKMSKNEIDLFVYYRNLKYTLISQEPKMREFDLFSSIGGILGLFIGISFVTLFEFGEFLMYFLLYVFEINV